MPGVEMSKVTNEQAAVINAKIKEQEEREAAMQRRSSRGPEDESVETDQGPPEAQTPGPLKQSLLDKAKGVATSVKDELTGLTHTQRVAIREAEAQTRFDKKMARAKGETIEEAPSRDSKPSRDSESSLKKGKKGKHKSLDDMFDEEDEESGSSRKSRGGKDSPVGTYKSAYHHNKPVPYESAFAGKNVVNGQYQEAYTGKGMANGVYKSPGNPKTYDMSREEPHEEQRQERRPPQQMAPRPVPQPVVQRARAPPMPMPTMGNFGNGGNIKMPTISLGGSLRNTSAQKMGGGNMPSINIPTLGGSTLLPGMGAGKKMGGYNIPKIGNWGKAPLKTELNLPNIGNLTIMGAGKQKGGIGFGLGEIPRLSLGGTPQKKKKV